VTGVTEQPACPVPGSYRPDDPQAESGEPVGADQPVEVTLVLRRRAPVPPKLATGAETLDADSFAAAYGADPADVELVRRVLTGAGLTVESVDAGSRRMQVSGRTADLARVFGTTVTRITGGDQASEAQPQSRRRAGELSVPSELDGVIVAVLGIDDRPQAQAHFRVGAGPAAAAGTSFTPVQLGQVYDFPTGTDGAGQTLAIVELGGGFDQADLDAYFAGLGLPTPEVSAVGVDGAANQPGKDPQGADGEVLLDVEVAGALAPKATLVVYFAPNTDRGFLDAVSTAVHATPTPTAVSISWGESEDSWTGQARGALDQAFVDAAALGVTVCVAAGDGGSSDAGTDGAAHVDFPAASPHVLACGGTTLRVSTTGAVETETVWNNGARGGATGGGVSDSFPLPDWQSSAGVPPRSGSTATGRGVPDVAADADPATGYQVLVDGQRLVIGGTSAVAPLWAALVCRVSQGLGRRLGLLQPMIYAGALAGRPSPGLRDITSGSNGAYSAGPGWDPCTGLGVPQGQQLLAALAAATPGT
jgi:kumamolisin